MSICLAILASSIVSGRFAFYCNEPLQVLFFTSNAGLLSSSMVAVLAVEHVAGRSTPCVCTVDVVRLAGVKEHTSWVSFSTSGEAILRPALAGAFAARL